MIAVGLATLVTGDNTIYTSQPATRADSPAHRFQFSFPLLNTLAVRDAMTTTPLVFTPDVRVDEAAALLASRDLHGAPVIGDGKRLLGIVTIVDIERVSELERGSTTVESITDGEPLTISSDATLDVAFESLATHEIGWMPVVDGREQKLIGTISASDIVNTYRASLRWTVRRMRGLTVDTVMLETRIEKDSPLAGKALRELSLPSGTLIISVQRDGATVLPRGNTTLFPGDVATFITNPDNEAPLRDYLSQSEIISRAETQRAQSS